MEVTPSRGGWRWHSTTINDSTQTSHHQTPTGARGPREPHQGVTGRSAGYCRGVEVPSRHIPAGQPIPKGCRGRTGAVPSPVLSCCTSYKFRSSLPLPPNALLLSGSRERLGIRKGLRSEATSPAGRLRGCSGRGAPMDLPSGMLLACSLCLLPGECPLPPCAHPASPSKGNYFSYLQKVLEKAPRLRLLEKSSREREGGGWCGVGEGSWNGWVVLMGSWV